MKIYKLRLKGAYDENKEMFLKENGETICLFWLLILGIFLLRWFPLDNDIKEEVTIIKSDIEGSEVKALIGARGHIINEHPKLLISIYHSNDDVWQIP